MRKVSMDGVALKRKIPVKWICDVPSHPLSENTKHSFPENGYECFFVYIRKEEKMESEKIKAGVRLILEGLVKT